MTFLSTHSLLVRRKFQRTSSSSSSSSTGFPAHAPADKAGQTAHSRRDAFTRRRRRGSQIVFFILFVVVLESVVDCITIDSGISGRIMILHGRFLGRIVTHLRRRFGNARQFYGSPRSRRRQNVCRCGVCRRRRCRC